MKNPIAMIPLLLLAWIPITAQVEEQDIIHKEELSFPGTMRSPNIPLTIGQFFQMPSSCAKDPTQFIRADRFIFPNASVGKIDSCTFIYELVQDTVLQATLQLPTALSVKQGGKQAAKQFGKPVYFKDGPNYVYQWNYSRRKKIPLSIRLEVFPSLDHGVMYIKALD